MSLEISAQPQPTAPIMPDSRKAWELTAEKAQHEMDPVKLSQLVAQLLREIDEAKR